VTHERKVQTYKFPVGYINWTLRTTTRLNLKSIIIPTNAVTLEGARLLTIEQVSEMLQVPVSWVREHVRANASDRIPGLKLGKY
jgi:hypothetical protein